MPFFVVGLTAETEPEEEEIGGGGALPWLGGTLDVVSLFPFEDETDETAATAATAVTPNVLAAIGFFFFYIYINKREIIIKTLYRIR